MSRIKPTETPGRLAASARHLLNLDEEEQAEEQRAWGWPTVTPLDCAIMVAVAAVAFVSYWHTLCPGVYPGASAVATANALGVLPGFSASHPVWLAIARGVTALRFPNPVHALNMFNALAASLVLSYLFLIVRRLTFLVVRPAPSWRMVPSEEDNPDDGYFNRVSLYKERETMEMVASTLGGLVAVFAFAFCVPFWQAATALRHEPFDLVLVLLTADCFSRYAFRADLGAGVVAMFLYGVLVIEWPVFVLFAPFVAAIIIICAIRHELMTESFLILMLVSGLVGTAVCLFTVFVFTLSKQALSAPHFIQALSDMVRTQFDATHEAMPRHNSFFVVVMPLLALAFSIKGCVTTKRLTDLATRWKWRAINLVFSAFVCVNLLNMPKSVWAIAREWASVPVLPSLAIAVCAGYLFVFWFLTARPANHENDPEHPVHGMDAGRLLTGYGLCGLLTILVLRMPLTNLCDSDGRKAAFADRCAHEVLNLSAQSRCLVADGLLDLNILISQKVNGSHLTVLPLGPNQTADACLPNCDRDPSPSATSQEKVSSSIKAFLIDWMRKNPTTQGQISFFCPVTFLQKAGIPTPPNGLCYTGTSSPPTKETIRAVLDLNQKAWQRLSPILLCTDETSCPSLSTRKAALRDVVSRVANDLGVYLQQAGLFAEADAAYTQARRFTPANLSATLNQFGLRLCHKEIGSSQELEALLLQRSRGPHISETMDQEICQGGLLVAQEADAILPEALTSIPVGTPVPPQLMALLSRWFPRSFLKNASETPIFVPPSADASDLNKAFAARAAGRTNHSETLLRRFVTEHPENLSAWALLAEQLLEKGSSDEVESRIIPAMRAANGSDQSALVEMTQGALCLHTKPPRQAMARAAFRRALQLSPALSIAGDQLLDTSLALGDAGFVEEDASTVIGCMPSNTLAHALLGSLRLKQQRYQEAEFHLRSSLASRASAGAHNDLAELYRRQKKWAEAEPHARAALRMDPGFYQAWDTLGYTLADSGRMSDAEAVFRCVTKLCPFAAEGYLGLAEVWRKQGRVKETAQLLQHVTAKLANMPPATRAKLERLRAELSLHIDLPEATTSGRPQISS